MLAKDHPFTFLDHAFRCGDSLVGLSVSQIVGFYWQTRPSGQQQRNLFRDAIERRMQVVQQRRQEIFAAREWDSYDLLRQKLDAAEEQLALARLAGDGVVAAFFSSGRDKDRQKQLDLVASRLNDYVTRGDITEQTPVAQAVAALRSGQHAIPPFHWEIEFPEVFLRENSGFDGLVGNPPFAGKNTMAVGHAVGYPDWLKEIHEESHGNADLVVHFFRRAFNLLRQGGAFGLIATNTIGQGDTRSTGLRWICNHGGVIYAATRRKRWPGQAAVIVSVVHVGRKEVTGRVGGVGQSPAQPTEGRGRVSDATPVLVGSAASQTPLHPPYELDGRPVPIITAYLFHAGGHDDPERLRASAGKSFQGSIVLGMGFTFDDTDTKDVASSIAEMHRLIAKDLRNAERMFPYIGGEEVNDSPTHAHHRYVINFAEMTEQEARRWPDLMRIVEERVKPERSRLGGNRDTEYRKKRWWLWGRYTPALFEAVRGLERVLVICRHQPHWGLAFLQSGSVFSEATIIVVSHSGAVFCTLQSRPHEGMGPLLRVVDEGRHALHPLRLLRDLPVPTQLRNRPHPRIHRSNLLRRHRQN
jgi:hypothetical protein